MRIIPDVTPDNDMAALRALALDAFGADGILQNDGEILLWAWIIGLIDDNEHAWLSGGRDIYARNN